jgi:RNA polymerase sigma-70 factor (ECF subfamily)
LPGRERRDRVDAAYRSHGDLVLRRARQILDDEVDAREALQEIFMSFVQDPEQLDGKRSLSAWLYSVTTHHCLNVLRNRRARARLILERVAPGTADARPPDGEARAIVRQALARLPDVLAQAAVYYYLDEMTHEEIAELLGYSRRHIGNLLRAVQERLHGAEAQT